MSADVRGGCDQATPLHLAAWNDCLEAAKALVDSGADKDAKSGNLHNNSPAGWAIVAGSAKVFDYLIATGAKHFPWFGDDAREACNGRFDAISAASKERRREILARLNAE